MSSRPPNELQSLINSGYDMADDDPDMFEDLEPDYDPIQALLNTDPEVIELTPEGYPYSCLAKYEQFGSSAPPYDPIQESQWEQKRLESLQKSQALTKKYREKYAFLQKAKAEYEIRRRAELGLDPIPSYDFSDDDDMPF